MTEGNALANVIGSGVRLRCSPFQPAASQTHQPAGESARHFHLTRAHFLHVTHFFLREANLGKEGNESPGWKIHCLSLRMFQMGHGCGDTVSLSYCKKHQATNLTGREKPERCLFQLELVPKSL